MPHYDMGSMKKKLNSEMKEHRKEMRSDNPTPKEGPYVQTSRAKATLGKTVAQGGTEVIRKKGKKPIAFKKGGLHETLGVPKDQEIPDSKMREAMAGNYGPKAKRQAQFKMNVLTGRKR